MKHKQVLFLTQAAVIAAVYVVLTMVFAPISFGQSGVDVRIAEALTILPVFTPAAVPGLFVGCLLARDADRRGGMPDAPPSPLARAAGDSGGQYRRRPAGAHLRLRTRDAASAADGVGRRRRSAQRLRSGRSAVHGPSSDPRTSLRCGAGRLNASFLTAFGGHRKRGSRSGPGSPDSGCEGTR